MKQFYNLYGGKVYPDDKKPIVELSLLFSDENGIPVSGFSYFKTSTLEYRQKIFTIKRTFILICRGEIGLDIS